MGGWTGFESRLIASLLTPNEVVETGVLRVTFDFEEVMLNIDMY